MIISLGVKDTQLLSEQLKMLIMKWKRCQFKLMNIMEKWGSLEVLLFITFAFIIRWNCIK